ncbi:pentatricopeptide repeat-containing protein At2g13600-like isoform X2 [Olea europaea var. sylvestris]|uniref:pentatricopeptide repeat-containing protein At2g13600-like isoform X2 n=1 Tax=Olea europaea var. sylvestris TaxID=158386 RepID=UPI000C1D2748|nr:pentatricopeptide repeat-containing protein At2g13600-like isoform X2 [Olea europaea var. sylvestris]
MMTGYAQNVWPQEVLKLVYKMYSDEEGFKVEGNCLTFVVCLEAISYLSDIETGRQVHAKIIRRLMSADTHNVVVGTALIDLYSKSGKMKYAQIALDRMSEKNTIAWTSIITCYLVHGLGFHALELSQQMMETGKVDEAWRLLEEIEDTELG